MNRRIAYDNRLCYERDVLRQQAIHREKVKHMVPTCKSPSKGLMDSHDPSHLLHVVKRNHKRQQMEKEKQMEIYRQNQCLANKMNAILHRQERILLGSTAAKPSPPSPSSAQTRMPASTSPGETTAAAPSISPLSPLSPLEELILEEQELGQELTMTDRAEDEDAQTSYMASPMPPRSVLSRCSPSPRSPQRAAHVHKPGVRLDANQMPLVDCHLSLETSMGRGNAVKKTTLVNKGVQRRHLERIQEENRKMLQRIRSQKPHYTLRKWDKQYEETTRKHQHLHSDGTVGYLPPRTSHGSRNSSSRLGASQKSPNCGAATSRDHEIQRNEWNSNTNVTYSNGSGSGTTNRDARLKARQSKTSIGTRDEPVSDQPNKSAAKTTTGQRNDKKRTNRLDQRLQQARSDAAELEHQAQEQRQYQQATTHPHVDLTFSQDGDDEELQVVDTTAVTLLEARTTRSIDLIVQEIQIEVNYVPLNASSTRGDRGLLIHATLDQMEGQCLVSMTTFQEIAQLLDDLEIMIKLETINCYPIGNFPRLSEVLTEEELQRLILGLVKSTHIDVHESTGRLCLYQKRPSHQHQPVLVLGSNTNITKPSGSDTNTEDVRNGTPRDEPDGLMQAKRRPTTCPSCSTKVDGFGSSSSPRTPTSPSPSTSPFRQRAASTSAAPSPSSELCSNRNSDISCGKTETNTDTSPEHSDTDPGVDSASNLEMENLVELPSGNREDMGIERIVESNCGSPLSTTSSLRPPSSPPPPPPPPPPLPPSQGAEPQHNALEISDHLNTTDANEEVAQGTENPESSVTAEVLDVEAMQQTLSVFSDLINCHRRCTRRLPTGSLVVCSHLFDATWYRLEQQVLNVSNGNFYKQTKQFSFQEIHNWLHQEESFQRERWLQRFDKDFMERVVLLEELGLALEGHDDIDDADGAPGDLSSFDKAKSPVKPRLSGNLVEILAFEDSPAE